MQYLLLVACLATASSAFLLDNYPAHASCHATWDFGVSCDTVLSKLLDQIKAWNGPSGCQSGGEKCLYVLKSSNSDTISATHETPVHHYVDDITFNLASKGSGCELKGYSTSETWYAHLDSSTNFCNMKNLITGSGLNAVAGFTETTDDTICTQHSSANCDKY